MLERDRKDRQWAIVELAEQQEGLLRHEQLLELGLDKSAIGRRLDAGGLHRRHRGVYTLGHRLLRPRGEWIAAVWAVPGCVLSHRSAAAFHGWIEAEPGVQHVTTIRRATVRDGLFVHRVATLFAVDVEHHELLAVTTPARTVVDLATVVSWPVLRAIADRIRTLDVAAIRAAQRRAPNRPGARNVRRLIGRLEAHTKSEFERRYLRFCRRHGVPLPDGVNQRVGGFLVDCRYPGVVLELDGRAFHARRDQMRTDRMRDRKLLRGRVGTIRLVWEDLDPENARETAADLRGILGAAR